MNEDFNPRDYPDGVEDDLYEVTGCESDAEYDDEYDECYECDDEYDDRMDGDFDSGMASAGHGTDEDYGFAEDVF
jgi:hypothetical protein